MNAKSSSKYQKCFRCGIKFGASKALCPSCQYWNVPGDVQNTDDTVLLSQVSPNPILRITTGPWDRCFGPSQPPYGIALGSVALIGGNPGAGKSTLSLQLTDNVCTSTEREALYIGAEESCEQIADRARRLKLKNMNRIRVLPIGSNSDVPELLAKHKPCATILDSLPGLTNDAEVAVQLCTRLKQYAVELNAPFIVIDHVTKQDDFAGLMALQHAVDTLITLYQETEDKENPVRMMTTMKNRFGPNAYLELVMTEQGLIAMPDEED